jgi:glutamyl-tRNA synthetase
MLLYYKYAESLINKNSAYVCTCSSENFKKFADNKKDCPCRKLNVKENLERWKKMLDKFGFGEGEAVLRFKSDMKHKNPAMRDFPLARINLTKHPRQGNKYRVWPLMNLAVATDDIELKMTHIIRGKDHRDNAERQEMIFKVLGKKFPWTAFLGRINFKDMELSSTQMRKDIEAKKFKSWDDKQLAEQMGLADNDKVINRAEFFQLLSNFNK